MTSGLPRTFRRLIAGETLRIGSRTFEVLTGGGHAPEQVMLFCRAENLLLCADQVLARISPNISVQAMDPEGDPLGIYLRSLASLQARHARGRRWCCRDITCRSSACTRASTSCAPTTRRAASRSQQACRQAPCTTADLVPVVFRRADRRSPSDGFCIQRGARPRQLHAARASPAAGAGQLPFTA